MRLALVVGSNYAKNGQVPVLHSAVGDCDRFERRLAEGEHGSSWQVERFDAERGVAEAIEQRLGAQTERIEQLLLFFSGYCALSDERGPALLLDGERLGTFSIARVRRLLDHFGSSACAILDCAVVLDEEQSVDAVVARAGEALTNASTRVSALLAGRPCESSATLVDSLVDVLDWLDEARTDDQPLTLAWLYEGLRADARRFAELPVVGLYPPWPMFEILPARGAVAAAPLPRFADPSDEDELTPSGNRTSQPANHGASTGSNDVLDALLNVSSSPVSAESPVLEEPAAPKLVSPTSAGEPSDDAVSSARTSVEADSLGDVILLEQQIHDDPTNFELRDRVIQSFLRHGHLDLAVEHCRQAARIGPTRPETYRRALALFQAMGLPDAAWNAASVLESLGEADINESLLAGQHRPDGLLAVQGSLDYGDWSAALLAGNVDEKLWNLLDALGSAGVRAALTQPEREGRARELDPALAQDPSKSTTTLAKTLGWSARLFGLTPPTLYVLPELLDTTDVAATELPTALAGRSLASGHDVSELAFVWARQLALFRAEARALGLLRSVDELVLLADASLALTNAPGAGELEPAAKRMLAVLRRELRGGALERVRAITHDLNRTELRARAEHLWRGVELVGVRMGLVACGDVTLAAELLQRFQRRSLTTVEQQLAELFTFSISEAYTSLRLRIGVAIAA